MNRWFALLLALALGGCNLPFGVTVGRPTATLAPVTMAPPPTSSTTASAPTLAATATYTPTVTLTCTPTEAPTITPTATISLLMPPAQTLMAQQTSTFVPPFATGRPTVAIELPLVALPGRDALIAAATFTPQVRPLIPGQDVDRDVTPMSGTATAPANPVTVEWTWRQSTSGTLLEASGLARNNGTRPVTMVTIDIAYRNALGVLVATAQAAAATNTVLASGQQAPWVSSVANPGGVAAAEITSITWNWAD